MLQHTLYINNAMIQANSTIIIDCNVHCKHIEQPEIISCKDELDAVAYAGERDGNDSASTDGEVYRVWYVNR